MKGRGWIAAVSGAAALLVLGCLMRSRPSPPEAPPASPLPEAAMTDPASPAPADARPADLSDAEWRRRLTPQQYQVCRLGGTEAAGTGAYLDNWRPGVYLCVACGAELFRSDAKFESGSGWPSFFQPAGPDALGFESGEDAPVSEVHCTRCRSHLGHVFNDGPPPTGRRY